MSELKQLISRIDVVEEQKLFIYLLHRVADHKRVCQLFRKYTEEDAKNLPEGLSMDICGEPLHILPCRMVISTRDDLGNQSTIYMVDGFLLPEMRVCQTIEMLLSRMFYGVILPFEAKTMTATICLEPVLSAARAKVPGIDGSISEVSSHAAACNDDPHATGQLTCRATAPSLFPSFVRDTRRDALSNHIKKLAQEDIDRFLALGVLKHEPQDDIYSIKA
jgi:hypothetical protein